MGPVGAGLVGATGMMAGNLGGGGTASAIGAVGQGLSSAGATAPAFAPVLKEAIGSATGGGSGLGSALGFLGDTALKAGISTGIGLGVRELLAEDEPTYQPPILPELPKQNLNLGGPVLGGSSRVGNLNLGGPGFAELAKIFKRPV